jgi:hypothetical protein
MKKIFTYLMILVLSVGFSAAQTDVFTQNFDGTWTVPSTLSPAWSGTTTATLQWHKNDYTTGWTYPTGGAYTPTGAVSTTGSARFHAYGITSPQTGDLITPTIDLSSYSAGTNNLEFYYINPTGTDHLNVYISTDNGVTWSASQLTCNVAATWTLQTMVLGTSSSTVQIKFTATSDYGDDDIGVDQVRVYNFNPTVPYFTIAPGSLNLGYTVSGGTSIEHTYAISGGNLTGAPGNIAIAAPTGFEVSLTSGSGFASSINLPYTSATLASTTIYVRFLPSGAPADYSGNITNVGGGASGDLAVTGSSILVYCSSGASNTSDEEIFSVTVNGATNAYDCSTVAPGPGSILNRYSNFTTLGSLTDMGQGTSVPFTILEDECDGATYYSNGCSIWIDFNQNGSFTDPGEQVYLENTTTLSPRTISGNISVPLTAIVGNTRMRITVVEGTSGPLLTPCLSYSYGETEDYTVNIIVPTAPTLSGVPSPLPFGYVVSGNTSAEQSYTLSGLNLTGAPGDIVVTAPAGFEVSLTSGSGFATSINVPYSTATLASTTIYVRFVPTGAPADFSGNITNTGGGANANVSVSGTSILQYCIANLGGDGTCPGDITLVSVNTLNNSTHTNCSTLNSSTYGNYAASGTNTTTLNRLSTYPLTVNTISTDIVSVWIDYNQNGTFEASEWTQVYLSGTSGSVDIIIPNTAVDGLTGMRIRSRLAGNPNGATDACSSFGSGICEDYYITIAPPVSCPNPSAIIISNITQTSVDVDWTENGTATSWQYEYGIQGFTPGTGTKAITSSKPVTINGLSASSNYSVRVRSICSAGDTSTWSGFQNFTTSCGVAALPYIQNFEAVTVPALPICMSYTNDNSDAYYWQTYTTSPHSAPNCAYIRYNSALAMNDWLYTPSFSFEAGKYYQVQFWYKNDGGTTYIEKLEVKYGPSASAAGMTSPQVFNDTAVKGAYKLGSGVFTPPTTSDYYVGFHGYSIADRNILVVDDILIKEIPFADIAVNQSNISQCDTLGWYNLPIIVNNVGQDTLKIGDTVTCTYAIDAGTPVLQKFVVPTQVLPGGSITFTFTTQAHLNVFTTYNIVYTIAWFKDMNAANNTSSFTMTFDPCTGIAENGKSGISVYPNPSTGIITVAMNELTGKIDVRVISLNGQILYEEVLNNTMDVFSKQIDLSKLPKGIYMMNIRNESINLRHKIVIE